MYKKTLLSLLIILLSFSFAEAKITVKEKTGREVLSSDKSPNQVVDLLKMRLKREAAAEVGTAIITNTLIENGKITKDEVSENTSQVVKETQIGNPKHITENNVTYIEITMRYEVDDDDVKKSIERYLENENDKKRIRELEREKKDLEERIKKMSKEEYNKSGISAEITAMNLASQKRLAEMQKASDIAHKELEEAIAKAERSKLEYEKSLAEQRMKLEQEELARKKRLAETKDAQAKDMAIYQGNLNNLVRQASENAEKLSFATSIEEVLIEVKGARVVFDATIKDFSSLMNGKNKELKASYDENFKEIKNKTYSLDKPKKEKYDTTSSYKSKLEDYENGKKAFEESKNAALKELEKNYAENVKKNEIENKKAMIKALTPYYERFLLDSNGEYPSSASDASIYFDDSTRNNDDLTIKFTITSSKHKKYSNTYKYDSLNDLRLMNETLELFRAIPQYGVEPKGTLDVKSYLHSYKVLHLGTDKYKVFVVNDTPEILPEIKTYENLFKEIHSSFNDKELTPNQLKLKERFKQEEERRQQEEAERQAMLQNIEDEKKQKEEEARLAKEEKERLKREAAERKKYETKAYSDYTKSSGIKSSSLPSTNVQFGGAFAVTSELFYNSNQISNMYYDINLRVNIPLAQYLDMYLNIAHIGSIVKKSEFTGIDRYGRLIYGTKNNLAFGGAVGLGFNIYLGTRYLFLFGDINLALAYNLGELDASKMLGYGGSGKAGIGFQIVAGGKPRFRVELFAAGMLGALPNKEPMYGIGILF